GHCNAVWLAADDVEAARRNVREAMESWSQSAFFMQHYRAMLANAVIELYVGDGERAYAIVTQSWRKLVRSFLMNVQYLRADAHFLRGRCALAAADILRGSGPAEATRRRALVAEARRMARKLEREAMGWTAPLASLLRAGVAQAQGRSGEAATRLRNAVKAADGAEMFLHAAAARARLGALLADDEGRALEGAALAWMAAQDIRVPERFVAMLAPGLDPTPRAAFAKTPAS
ncbi:MAG TPA: hypothetical protein VKU41_03935, partial [Polyangiaceae bacterium]|nr:hypothetical protein [Polyangiaceae bacterium]